MMQVSTLHMAAVVLAGGMARRMGGVDKPLLGLGDTTVLGAVIGGLRGQVQSMCIAGGGGAASGDARRFAGYDVPVVADLQVGAGPLAGVGGGLAWAEAIGADTLLVVPGDTPFIPADLAARLYPAPCVAEAGGRTHHLVCTLSVGSLPVLVAWLAEGHTRAGDFLTVLGARRVVFSDADAFLNINTPDDLVEARRRVSRPASL